MAKGQQGGGGTVWIIVFAALWMVSTIVVVIQYTAQEELRADTESVLADNERLISAQERRALSLFQQARAGGPTIVGLIEGARSETAELATGDGADDPAAVQTKLDELLRTIQADGVLPRARRYDGLSYHEALTKTYAAFKAIHTRLGDAEKRAAELNTQTTELAAANAQQKEHFEARIKEASERVAAAEADRTKFRSVWDTQVETLGREYDDRRAQSDADLTKERQRTALLEASNNRLEERMAAFQKKFGDVLIGPRALATAREPDGSILHHVPGDDLAFIDLGRNDRLVRGLRFAVYSAHDGIPESGRAKAQIEVVAINEASSECRIVSLDRGQVILPGDLIANPVYDRDREVSFLVLGAFDLDHDGNIDPRGAADIEAMISNWGGRIVTDLNASLDYLVLGTAPRTPRQPRDQSPESLARYNATKQAYDSYRTKVRDAKTLTVPILRQEVFLSFLGYARPR